jgi:DNA-binding transcriptional LysR family regulator
MVDPKIKTLLTLQNAGSYTKAAKALSLTQPAVSNHIKLLEQEYGIHIFIKGKHELRPTPEGLVLLKYARRVTALSSKVYQALEDARKDIKSLTVGITPTASDILVPQVLASYCNKHPQVKIQILRETIKNIDSMLNFYEIDFAIVDGVIKNENTASMLLGTDYLGLVVSPLHPFAKRASVKLEEIQGEKFVLRPKKAETRRLFESYLISHGYDLKNFNVIMEMDSVSNIKEIVMANLGITMISHNVCLEEERRGKLVIVPIEDCQMLRQINLIYPKDFSHPEILQDIHTEYAHSFIRG